jgi:hypothetical protein
LEHRFEHRRQSRKGGEQVSEDEREILRTARKSAMDVLSASSAEAERVADGAEVDAVALLLEQQRLAERVLREQEAAEAARAAGKADDLLEAHRTAAELLAAAEDEVAAKLRRTTTSGGVDVLMAGQRKAAAILLDAWMRVTEARPPDGERSD